MTEFKLWENEIPFYKEDADTPNYMTFYSAETHYPSPCVIIYPGGGYANHASHEGEPVARFFNSRGIHAAVVKYRIKPNCHPAPLADAQRAIKIIRSKAKELYINPDQIVTMGFSAGGHLAASTVTLPEVQTCVDDEISKENYLPNGAILCYPVIDMTEPIGNVTCGYNLLGDDYEAKKHEVSLQNYVSEKTPQVFIWHTSVDRAANVKNSLVFAEKLRDFGIPFEMHIFPRGRHGLGLAKTFFDVSKWADLAADWIIRNII